MILTAVAVAVHMTPSPAPSAVRLRLSGYLRAYDFTRQNASNAPGVRYTPTKYDDNAVNQQSFESAASIHGAYSFSTFTLGASYLFADPFDACRMVSDQFKGSTCAMNVPPATNPDNQLPGYELSTLYEAYAEYIHGGSSITIGNQLMNTPWANQADTRVKPMAYQGANLSEGLGEWSIQAMDILRFEPRNASSFTNATLLTSYPPTGNNGIPGNSSPPANVKFATDDPFGDIPTSGFWAGRAAYTGHDGLTGEADYYDFEDIATALWLTARYVFPAWAKPFVGFQLGEERNGGSSVIGRIDSQITGLQSGVNVAPGVQLSAAIDDLPWRSALATLPAGAACNASTHQLSLATPAHGYTVFPYFLPNYAPQCTPGLARGTAIIFYGGWASPYTYGTTGDPLYTTMLTQGFVDRNTAGTSWKTAATYTSSDHRFVATLSHALYNAGNAGGEQLADENDLDVTFYAGRAAAGAHYRGLVLRYRYGSRTYTNTLLYGGLPLFKYNRSQLEYDF